MLLLAPFGHSAAINIFLVSTKSPFKLLYPPIKGHVKKNFFKEECVPMCELRKTSLGASLGQMGKQLHAGAMKPEPGFYGSGQHRELYRNLTFRFAWFY